MRPFALFAAFCLFQGIALEAAAVDAATLNGKVMCGYQGWFTAAGDDNPFSLWIHWGKNHKIPDGTNLRVEMYPDLYEFDIDELFPTAMTRDGAPAYLYSGRTPKTVDRHVRWMKQYGIDGIFAQRFVLTLYEDPGYTEHMNAVGENLLQSCEAHGRVFAVMYDVSGASEDRFRETMQSDWTNLVDLGIVDAPCYLKHEGKPVLGIWGFGFKDGVHPPANPAVAQAVLDWFKSDAPEKYRATVFGGVPAGWRDLSADSRTDAAWANVYRSFDVISPWTVGRYVDESGADSWKASRILPDLTEAGSCGIDYCPVVWPGFSWHNLTGGQANQIPRNGGNFYWRQAYNAVTAGVDMIYVAMFDEVDEATAIYKTAPTAADAPDQGYWLTLDADGYSVPSDWYLRLTFEMGRMLRDDTLLTPTMPPSPGPHYTDRGTPTAWLESYGLITNGGFDSADKSDTDYDGMFAWQEHIAGTVPTNGLSLFDITDITIAPNTAAVAISWHAVTGRLYSVYTSSNILDGVTNHSSFSNVEGVSGVMSCTNIASSPNRIFYRLGVSLTP